MVAVSDWETSTLSLINNNYTITNKLQSFNWNLKGSIHSNQYKWSIFRYPRLFQLSIHLLNTLYEIWAPCPACVRVTPFTAWPAKNTIDRFLLGIIKSLGNTVPLNIASITPVEEFCQTIKLEMINFVQCFNSEYHLRMFVGSSTQGYLFIIHYYWVPLSSTSNRQHHHTQEDK